MLLAASSPLTAGFFQLKTHRIKSNNAMSTLTYQPPFDWNMLKQFLAKRAIIGVEQVLANRYVRTLSIEHKGEKYSGWLAAEVADNSDALSLTLSPSLLPVAENVTRRVVSLFDLDADPQQIASTLGALATQRPGMRVPGAVDGFEVAVRAILGQQITVAAASTLAARVATLGDKIETPFAGLTHLFPSAARLATIDADQLGRMGVIGSRIKAIKALAVACNSGDICLIEADDVAATMRQLVALPGIGDWTAQYIAMRALGWRDAFPASDHGVLKALGVTKPKLAKQAAEHWRPYRAYAVMHLWS